MTDAQPGSPLSWADRFRGAMLGGAVGDALGAGVRHLTSAEIQQWFGPRGVVDYLPVYGRRGAVTDLTQLTVFTLEALLRARAMGERSAVQAIEANHLAWLHTQGVPWAYAMSKYAPSEPTGWLLQRPELYSTRNPGGAALLGLGGLVHRPAFPETYQSTPEAPIPQGMSDCIAWTAPLALWSQDLSIVDLDARTTAALLTKDSGTVTATELHADVLAQLLLGHGLWAAVEAWQAQRAFTSSASPHGALRTAHAAMFATNGGRRPSPAQLDIEFDTRGGPGDLGIALAAVAATNNFTDAVIMAVNHSSDSAVTGALAGQLAGAIYGPGGIPPQWLDELELGEIIETLCQDVTVAFAPPKPPQWMQRYVPNARQFGGPRELIAGAPNTVEGAAEQTMVLPAIKAEPEPDPAADTPPHGIGAPTFPAARAETPAEPVEFEVADPSSTGPIPVPRLRSSETTAVFPTADAPGQPEAVEPEWQQVRDFPVEPEWAPSVDAPAAVESELPVAGPVVEPEWAPPVDAPAAVESELPVADPVVEPEWAPPVDAPAAAEPEFPVQDPVVEPQMPVAEAAFVEADDIADPIAGEAPENPVAPEEFVPEEIVAAALVDAPPDVEPPVATAEPVSALRLPTQPMAEREPVDLEPPPRSPIDLEPADFGPEPEDVELEAPASADAERTRSDHDEVEPETDTVLPGGSAVDAVAAEALEIGEQPEIRGELLADTEAAEAEPQSLEPAPAVPPIVRGEHAKAEGPGDGAPSLTERVLGCFLGGALGDALGADLEFKTAEEITARFGADGPSGLREAYGVHGAITDDTQMTLFTAEGMIRGSVANRMLGNEDPLPEVQLAYQRWLHTQGVEWDAAAGPFLADYPAPDGWLIEVPGLFKTRAPGKTVFRALSRFGDGHPAGSFTERINDSKGCGGVMRAAPVALWATDPAVVFRLAARTAALTHSHPAGYHSAGALAVIVQQALLGRSLDDGVWLALQVLETWADHDETSAMLKAAVHLAGAGVPTPQQIAEQLGGGWVGDEALAIAVCAALVGGEDVELALRIAVHHDGDSDSTGAICGNIVGALLGVGALPVDWLAELELRDVVEQVALDCVAEFGRGAFQPGQAAVEPPTDEDWNERYPIRPQWSSVSAPAGAEPSLEFPAPKPAPRRINGVVHTETFEGENR
ncbi:ADP-ribosylglycohydrolase family protein [Saccharopolyspora sp. K220]|uniref:ADP-ribosylglycohydrolase family protein n=1 Tax=Saccharopolyspora soli TaxID=2926618 RepID=UPI001F58C8DA|nr:ADP-ribosylglycohydrolase family protein [Saccharopolyspora soli]MCI2417115.1 ADP-ribosylglycohydrolase family protein [Saccharopolyspora soli]